MRARIFALLAALALPASAVAYRVEPSRLLVATDEQTTIETVLAALGPALEGQGFEDLGKDEAMSRLLAATHADDSPAVSEPRDRHTYLHRDRGLRIEVIDFPAPAKPRYPTRYERPAHPFVEVSFYEQRPGGFSAEGHAFHAWLQATLEQSLGKPVLVAVPPPPTNQIEYWRATLLNAVVSAGSWLIAFGLAISAWSLLSRAALGRPSLPRGAKLGIFVLAGTWLATPMPFPAASIAVVLLPHLFAFPWNNPDYYQRVQEFALFSFPVSFALCLLIAPWVFPRVGTAGHDARARATKA